MVKIKVLLLALAAVFLCSVVAASGASAAEWLLEGKPVGDSSKQVLVDSVDEVSFSDMKGGIFGEEVTVRCQGDDHRYVWNQGGVGMDEIDMLAMLECTTTKGTCAAKPTVVAENLPWTSELTSSTTDLLKIETGKEPAWEISCSLGVSS